MTKKIKPKARGHWTPDALKTVQDMASNLKLQSTIAAQFGITLKQFESQIAANKGDNPLRLAWERGRAIAEQAKIDKFTTLIDGVTADSKMPVVAAFIFFMKAQFGWRDKPEDQGRDAAKITLVLPGPMSEADYLRSLGVTAPVDSRKALPAPGETPNMKDVTPGSDGKLPTKIQNGV